MASSNENSHMVLVTESVSTRAAQGVLASQTRAFGNKAAKLDLQTATTAFVHAKQTITEAQNAAPTDQEHK